jgi:hypothetical protein
VEATVKRASTRNIRFITSLLRVRPRLHGPSHYNLI